MLWALWGPATGWAEPDEPAAVNTVGDLELVDDLEATLTESLKVETQSVALYQSRLIRIKKEQVYLAAAMNGYQLQLSTFGNLLLSVGVEISLLEKTRAELKSSMVEIQRMMDELVPNGNALALELKNLEQQRLLIERQIEKLIGINRRNPGKARTRDLEKTARRLASLLRQKEKQVVRLHDIYQRRLGDWEKLQSNFSALEVKFAQAIEGRKKKSLFERNSQAFPMDAMEALARDGELLGQRLSRFTDAGFWRKWFRALWQSTGAGLFALAAIFTLVGGILIRIRLALGRLRDGDGVARLGRWHGMVASLAALSVVPAGLSLFAFLASRRDGFYVMGPALEVLSVVILVLLAGRWLRYGLSHWESPWPGSEKTLRSLGRLFRAGEVFVLVHVCVYYLLGRDSSVLATFRMAGALLLLAWAFVAWNDVGLADLRRQGRESGQRARLLGLGVKYLLLLVGGTALILDTAGYASLSMHWLLSWVRTLVIVFWWALFFKLIQEWDQYYREKSSSERNEFLYDDYPIQWLMIRAGQLCWLVSLVLGSILAWGSRETIFGRLYPVLAHPMEVGSMSFSVMGIILAILVLLVTYAVTRIWIWIFKAKFLSKSGMAVGLKESITTITVYAIWMVGILISLHVFGLNTASLAVAFGALGIGLGFGLQTIFNNFISGIILLFERPIQVGDDVEINGEWAQVKKINVRSTVVQTYDNASVIIPNADFISNQVTNWSFKDKRIRRQVDVGVAYGSDVEKVRETLLEIAGRTPYVLKYPKPDVLFRDFADSALVFRLRIWTDIDHMLTVETDIRFEVDRLFRERKIEISFPQRDIHIRSMAPEIHGKAGPKPTES